MQGAHGLIERDEEIAAVDRLLRETRAGVGGSLRIIGASGVGKTALLRAARDRAHELGCQVLSASAGRLEGQSPYGLVRRLFDRPLMSLQDDERDRLREGPARLAVSLILGEDVGPLAQGDLLRSLAWLLDALARRAPVLLIADDVQWADEESLLFLASLRESVHETPALVVVAARETTPETRTPAFAQLVAEQHGHVLRLGLLTADGVRALLERTWHSEVDAEVAGAVAQVSGGNPFLVLALTRLLDERHATPERVREAVPGDVIDTVVDRLAGLPEAEQALARAVAVLEHASIAVAADLADLALDIAGAAADRLRQVGLFGDQAEVGYRHALLGSGVYAATGADVRDRLHHRAARLLAADPFAATGHLLQASGRHDPWVAQLLRTTAAQAIEDGAPQSAVALLRRAVAEPPREEDLPATLLELGLAEMRTFDPACLDSLSRAEQSLADPDLRAQASLALGQAFTYAGQHELAADLLTRAVQARPAPDRDRALELEAALVAAELLVPSRVGAARARLAARADLAGRTRGERLFVIQQISAAVGENRSATVIRDLARRALSADDLPEGTDWVWARLFLSQAGCFEEVRELTDIGFAQAAARGSVIGFVTTSFVRAMTEWRAGCLIEAEGHFRALVENGDALGGGLLVETLGYGGLAQTLARLGRVEEALGLLDRFPEVMPSDAPANGVGMVLHARGIVREAAGDHEGALAAAYALRDVVTAIDADSPMWAAWRPLAVEPLRALGRLEEARALADEQLALCERSAVPGLLGEALRWCGLLAPDPIAGLDLLDRSVRTLVDAGSLLEEASSLIAWGSALRRSGRRADARPPIRAGLDLARRIGAEPLAIRAEQELIATGERLTSGGLTASERRVAELAASGLRNRDIAAHLFISVKTVEAHLSRCYLKLGVSGREDLVRALGRTEPGEERAPRGLT